MRKGILTRLKWDNTSLFMSIVKIVYFNLIKINKFAIFELRLTQDFEGPSLDSSEYQLKIINHKELEDMIPVQKLNPREFYMHDMDGVENCVIITSGNQIGHISWIYMKGDKDRWFDLTEKQAHVNFSITDPQFRGKNFFPNALRGAAKWLKENDFETILMDVHEDTKFMIKSMKKIKEVERIGTLKHWFLYRPKFIYHPNK